MQSAQSTHAEEDVLAQDRTFAVVTHFDRNEWIEKMQNQGRTYVWIRSLACKKRTGKCENSRPDWKLEDGSGARTEGIRGL